jgi:hypothetical protein
MRTLWRLEAGGGWLVAYAVFDASPVLVLVSQRVTKQWTDVFERPSPEMAEAGITLHTSAPEAVARRVVTLHKENGALRDELDSLKQQSAREAAALRRSMRDQAAASEEQVRLEARRVRREVAADLEAARAAADESRGEMARVRAEATAAVGRAVREAVAEARTRVEAEAARAVEAARAEAEHSRGLAEAARAEAEAGVAGAREEARAAAARAGAGVEEARLAATRAQAQAASALAERDSALEACERRLSDAATKYASSVDARRVGSLERHCVWLEGRVGELERLLDSYRSAGRAHAQPSETDGAHFHSSAGRAHAQPSETDGAHFHSSAVDDAADGDDAAPTARLAAPRPEQRPVGGHTATEQDEDEEQGEGAGAGRHSVRFHLVGEGESSSGPLASRERLSHPHTAPVIAFTRPGSGRVVGSEALAGVRDAARARGGRRLRGQAVVAWVEPSGSGEGGFAGSGAVFAARPVSGDAASRASGEAWRRSSAAQRTRATRLYMGQPTPPAAASAALGDQRSGTIARRLAVRHSGAERAQRVAGGAFVPMVATGRA